MDDCYEDDEPVADVIAEQLRAMQAAAERAAAAATRLSDTMRRIADLPHPA